ncbi:spore germination protein GerPE [Cohnella candidum]|uniref:Spore germination protein GerPE n=1 Tax=Cohnella candidum TaxID=2674991 RepID=A0A3G3JXI0_9BACL|nr:spore germination protein GerPE [Cohnella candidum]AYQ72862.1 spore germination protein GerPE [Cohnella candidum]
MSVEWRVAKVGYFKINQIFHGAIAQFGDNDSSVLFNRTIALQRAIPDFFGDETRFAAYPIFFLPLRELVGGPEGTIVSRSETGDIRVGAIHALSVTASSLIRIGSAREIVAESRVKHIRQYNDRTGL